MSAHWASVLQIFCPVTRHPSPCGSARVRKDARSLPASGSLNSWHQTCSPERMRGSSAAFCCLGAEGQEGVGGQHHLVEWAVGVAEDELLHHDQVVHRVVVGTAAPCRRPAAAEVAGVVQGGEPRPDRLLLLLVARHAQPFAAHRVPVGGDERTHLGPEGLDVNRHTVHPSSSASSLRARRGLAASRASWWTRRSKQCRPYSHVKPIAPVSCSKSWST